MRVRTSMAAAGLAAAVALVLTGCGSESDGGDTSKGENTATGPTASDPADASKDPDSGKSIEGAWAGLTDGKPVSLAVAGTKAAVSADGRVCSGEVVDHGEQMLSLKCTDGNKDRTMGTIKSSNGKLLVISWESGKEDSLTKAEVGQLPTNLPKLPGS
ncbi:hypothetical protein ACWEFL_17295 [Streptomyces sp. NPDC004838]